MSAGSCTVEASQAGNATYAPATPVARTFTVSKAAQSISFGTLGDLDLDAAGGALNLSATASSGLAVTFTSSTAAVCTVSGATMTLVAAGTCTIAADQSGDATYAAAATVSNSFTVHNINYFANGGFEISGSNDTVPKPASAWRGSASGYSRTDAPADVRSGFWAAQLAAPNFSASVMLQNSVEDGGRPTLNPGDDLTLTFWAKGYAGGTGNVLFALRYLDGTGNILANSGNIFFQADINEATWTKITYKLGPVPAAAVAAFIEFSQAIGPIDGANPAGKVLIDDLTLRLEP
ncbi:MAG: hypothetical protein OEU93_01755 [Rubrivivax sp.]|nr:hypothetical protein [Rubrivivax sp.]